MLETQPFTRHAVAVAFGGALGMAFAGALGMAFGGALACGPSPAAPGRAPGAMSSGASSATNAASGPRASGANDAAPAPSVRILRTLGDVTVVSAPPRGFERISARERVLAYHLSAAALAGDTLFTRQTSRFAFPAWQLVERMIERAARLSPEQREAVLEYRRWLFVFHGLHDKVSGAKWRPPLERAAFEAALRAAGLEASGALLAAMFDPLVLPQLVARTPAPGKDPILESAANHYEGLSSADLEGHEEHFELNGRLVARGGRIEEQVYRAGRGATPAGLGAEVLRRVITHLEAAIEVAPADQQRALRHLVEYFALGEAREFREHDIAWVAQPFAVDYILGFITSYLDVRQRKGSFMGFVGIPDPERDPPLKALAGSAAYFERQMPWAPQYQRDVFRPPAISALNVLMATGDGGLLTFGGANLPNPQELRERFGTKNFLAVSTEDARRAVRGSRFIDEYAPVEARAELLRCQAPLATTFVALHEVIGHGSGKVSASLRADPAQLLAPYFDTLEEARANLVADDLGLDPKLVELGLLPDAGCARAVPAASALRLLTGYLQVPSGDRLEEDHLRADFIELGVLLDQGALRLERRGGKTYLIVPDQEDWRAAVAALLAELHTIKATGDVAGIRRRVEAYGTRLDTALRDELLARRPTAPLPEYVAPLPARLTPLRDATGQIIDVRADEFASLDEYIEAAERFDQD
jgi:dipeptidyl-peptidase III